MSTTKLLGKKRIAPFLSNSENDQYTNDITIPEILLITNYSEQEIKDLNQNELENSWNQNYKISKKLPLKNEKYKIKKNFSKNPQLFQPIKKYYLFDKVRSNNDLSQQEKNYISYCLESKNYSLKQIIDINRVKNIPFTKFNLVLDIDFTMLKAVELTEINFQKKETDIQVNGVINNNTPFEYYCRYRPYLFHFINEIKDYFNFYVSTLGHTNYANKIIDDFKQKANIIIPQKNIISNVSDKLVKNIDEIKPISNDENKLNNTIIIDDIVNFWIKPPNVNKNEKDIEQCIKCLIPAKRYVINNATGNDKQKFGILIHNNIFEERYDKKKNYSIDIDFQYCIEKDSDSENAKHGQFFYLTKFIKKCIGYSLFSGIPLVNTIDYFRKKIFEDCKFNLKYLGNEWNYSISNIIRELGGIIVISLEETTHFIIENKINMKNIIKPKDNQIFININYIFQCYFNLNRMNEYEKQFKVNTYN